LIIQTNGLLLKKLHRQINDSPLTKIAVSIDGLRDTNDKIRGIRGYFDLALEGIRLLRGKEIVLSVTLNKASAAELTELSSIASGLNAGIEYNILSQNLFFFQNADIAPLWPEGEDIDKIGKFLQDELQRPAYEVDYVTSYYARRNPPEPPCVLGFLQVFVLSNGDVLTGCYPLKPVGNILQTSLADVLKSDAYRHQAEAMVKRDCPGCTCGVESSLAMQNAGSSALFHIREAVRSRPALPRFSAKVSGS